MQVAQTIIDLGGASKVAKLLGQKVTTVQYWLYTNSIPEWRRHLLERLVAEHQPMPTLKPTKRRGKKAPPTPPRPRPYAKEIASVRSHATSRRR